MATSKKNYHQGHDIKSLLLNLATLLLFILPVVAYLDQENAKNYCLIVAGGLVISVLAPPFGFYRPHPYSDWPANKPFMFKRE